MNFFSLKNSILLGLSTIGLSTASFVIDLPFLSEKACAQNIREIWSKSEFIEGRGVTNCGPARVENDVRGRCNQRDELNNSILDVVDIHYYNYQPEFNRSWDGKRSCVYRATYQCKFLVRQENL